MYKHVQIWVGKDWHRDKGPELCLLMPLEPSQSAVASAQVYGLMCSWESVTVKVFFRKHGRGGPWPPDVDRYGSNPRSIIC